MSAFEELSRSAFARAESQPDRNSGIIEDVVLADILIEDIKNGWTEFCAVCDAVAAGRISAVLACERFGSASRGEKAYKAGHAYGLLLRTLHLCDTLTRGFSARDSARA